MLKIIEAVREREREHNFNKLSFTFDAKKEVLVSIVKIEFNKIDIGKRMDYVSVKSWYVVCPFCVAKNYENKYYQEKKCNLDFKF